METFKPKDIIAVIVLIGYFVLKYNRYADGLDEAIFLLLGYYFVKRTNGSDNGK